MNNFVTELHIINSDGSNLFDTDKEYIIPLYQRAYAWEDKQLIQLIEDINDVPENASYHIGSLIVSEQNGRYEVVDGQQRLTSLYLLLNCLGIGTRPTLTFACRPKSNHTLKTIKSLLDKNGVTPDTDGLEHSILQGIKILFNELQKSEIKKNDFIKKLSRVILYRIEVPKNTDLNRYFEIMNTRGEQLEQHDILKAEIKGYLPEEDRDAFAKIWDACSDMTGYVQMHFVSSRNTVREAIFTPEWNAMPRGEWENYRSAVRSDKSDGDGLDIRSIIASPVITGDDGETDDGMRVRFESIIDFPYFLLHVLKV